jgi:formate/nitrite transporter
MAAAAAGKMGAGPVALLMRGILCNFLVCLAVWSAGRATSDAGKLIMIFWCLFAFITTGFEHSVANMTYIPLGIFLGADVSWGAFFIANLLPVTIGNLIGGAVVVPFAYYYAYRK